jgi:S-DNA-T family DNA segregation ATPase FtsK/SpoIIIE
VWATQGTVAVVVVVAAVGAVAALWRRLEVETFQRVVQWPLLARYRRITYRLRWQQAMTTSGLATRSATGAVVLPALESVKTTGRTDVLTARMVLGQVSDDFAAVTDRLAEAFNARVARVGLGARFGEVTLTLWRSDPLAAVVAPLPISSTVDITALPVGLAEDGSVVTVRLAGSQVLIAGATGSGKSSALWSVIRAMAGGIAAARVQIWAIDPKGGMELAPGAKLFTRFVYTAEAAADLLDQATELARTRAERLRGAVRIVNPSAAEPLVVVLIDELAALTAYLNDRAVRDRIKASLGLLLTQGRAVGVHVIAAVQDPRKEVVSFRALFPTRIGLRMAESDEVDLVLGNGMRDRGALCDRIPHVTPGIGYVVVDGNPTPIRTRFSYLTDADVRTMAVTYAAPLAAGGEA